MATADESTVEPPRAWVEAFLDSEAEIRGVLDDVREAHLLGEYETVREKLRAFAQVENGIFRVVALAVLDVDRFYTDLAAQYEDENPPTEELQTLGSEFDRLADALVLVQSILNSTRQLLEQVDANEDPIAEHEQERIANMHRHLSEERTEMAAYIDATDEESETDLEPFDDWSFY